MKKKVIIEILIIKKRIYNMFACAMTKYQIKLVIESYRLVIEFSHRKF